MNKKDEKGAGGMVKKNSSFCVNILLFCHHEKFPIAISLHTSFRRFA
jgi:hypothetical protein